jgi:hypothetical protein
MHALTLLIHELLIGACPAAEFYNNHVARATIYNETLSYTHTQSQFLFALDLKELKTFLIVIKTQQVCSLHK